MNKKYFLHFLSYLLLMTACGPSLPPDVAEATQYLPEKLDYNIHVKPILSDRCFACHGNDKNKIKAGLRLNSEAAFLELPESPGKFAIVPKKLESSQVFHRLISDDPEVRMPPAESNLTLTAYEKAVIIQWIKEGAEYKAHWAFIKPEKKAISKVKQNDWVQNPIDNFVLKKLEQKGWTSSEKADKETLLRRVTFDLTGLPPTLEAIDAFLNDKEENAFEKVVDRLLNSPQYGERMAVDWMDLSRFADTHGYTVDRFRDMSPWRDWVISAFNQNMRYDTFSTWQLAGDLLPNPSKAQILATGFNRNHQQNMEGGIVDEEYRVEYVADRTNTLGAAYLGLTVECARCHDHKYDPISQKEYFELFSFFNNVNEAGQISYDNAMPVPTILLTDDKVDEIVSFLDQKIAEKNTETELLQKEHALDFEQWMENERLGIANKFQKPRGLRAHYNLDKKLSNRLNPTEKGEMKQMFAKESLPEFVKGKNRNGLLMNGDAWLDLGQVGLFDKSTPFSVGIWVNIPEGLENGVIFHKGTGAAIYNFRGYHLALKDNKLEVLMAHTTPANAIIEYADNPPRNEWIHLMMTYDGSGKAVGLNLFQNGIELATKVDVDNLYKDILFHFEKDPEPGLQIGARWRGVGIKGAMVDDITVFEKELTALEVLNVMDENEAVPIFSKPVESLSVDEKTMLKEFYFANFSKKQNTIKSELQKLRKEQNAAIDTVREVMVMQEMKTPRQAYILERGQYDAHGEPVDPSTIKAVLPFPKEYAKNRLGLAKWLFDEDHPLTARVAVNRFWLQLFGRGLVKSIADFGNQGEMPSHPELLDWMAIEFQNSDWNVKELLKKIVMSSTYQQSSKIRNELVSQDVENVMLWRGPTQRLTAEMMRDNALAASNLLVKKIGGKSVKPYQPDGLWKINGGTYMEDTGEKLYRRSLYTFWKRTVPPPTQGTFDAPTRSYCTVERQKTNTPLQALVLMNDPTYTEAAKVIGEHISRTENPTIAIAEAFKKLTGRVPSEGELQVLLDLQQTEYEKFISHPEKMKGWLTAGAYEVDQKIALALLVANTVVASTILNADATIIKR